MRKPLIGMLIAFCAFQFMFVSCLFTQDLPFTNYTADDGLAQSEINFILQDSKGYLWFATWKGISRFDGQVFTNYTVEDGLAHNAVKAMLEDKHSVLWFGTYGGGVSRFDGKTWRTFTREDGLADNFVNTIFEDTEGNLWFGTEKGGASRFDGISWETFTNEDGLANNLIEAILEDTEGNLWFGAVGGLSRFDGEKWETFTTEDGLANNVVYSIIEKSRGELWIGTFNGISRFDGNQWRTFTIEDGLVHNYVHSIYQDSEGNLWFGTQGGVSKFDGKTWTSITEDEGLVNNTVETILEDTEGNLWFGTVQGVSKLGGLAFLNYTEEHGLADNKVLSIMEDVRGHLWFGTYGGGASRFDGVRWETFTKENGLAVDFVYSILEDSEGNLWFGTHGGGVNLFDRKNWRHFTSKDGAGSYVFYTIYEDTKGNLWFGTDNGVSRFDGKNWRTFTEKDGLTEKAVYTIIEDNKGDLWFGTYGGGVNRFDGEEWWSFTTKNGLVNDFILTNFKDAKGNLWFGTERGLSKYDGKSFFNYTTKNGLSDNNCCFITGDDNYLYVGTSKGVNRFDGKTFKLYTTQEGLAANEMNRGACLKDSKGDLWFGTTAGVSKYNPQLDKPDLIPPPVYITRVSLLENDSTITYVSELKHSENFLRFDYAGICFTAPEALIYHYKLEGSDTDWQESTLRTVQYTHLPSGHYTFKVNARNKDGIWSKAPAEFSFVITPPYWNTWWFRILSTVLLVGIIYGVFKEWHKRKTAEELKEKNVRLENTIERLTQEIAERKQAEEALRESEERFRTIFDKAQIGIVLSNSEGKYLEVNPFFQKITGYTEDKLRRMTFAELTYPDDVEKDLGALRDMLQRKRDYYRTKKRYIRKDGRIVCVDLIVSTVYDTNGKFKYNFVLAEDITERKQAEEALRESEERYRNLVETMNDGLVLGDESCKFTFVNKSFCKMLVYSPEELLGNYVIEFVRDDYKDLFSKQIALRKKGGAEKYELALKAKDGETIYTLVSPRGYYNKYGRLTKSSAVFTDITERKRAEEEREKFQELLTRAQKMESLGLLAGGVAHDLNNILSGLVTVPQLLEMQIDMILGALDEKSPLSKQFSELKKPVEAIRNSGQKAANVVQDLLTLARSGIAIMEVLNLNDIVKKQLSSPEFDRLKALNQNIQFRTKCKSDLLNIRGSETHLLKSLMNLVTNAAEAMPQGGKVTITTRNRYIDRPIKGYDTVDEGDYAVLTVADNGTGISHEDLQRIFEPFYTKKEMGQSGTGLGMSVVWGTVKDHDGYIDVDSIEGEGTTFTLYFPATREEVEKKKAVISIEGLKGHGETILVVDDVEEQREIASRILTTLGYDVKVVSSGEEAIEYLRYNSADLLLLDMIMDPGIDGLDTYKGIVEIHPGQKAVIDSGFSETERVKEAQRLGAGAYVKKPYTLEKLGTIIRQELHKK